MPTDLHLVNFTRCLLLIFHFCNFPQFQVLQSRHLNHLSKRKSSHQDDRSSKRHKSSKESKKSASDSEATASDNDVSCRSCSIGPNHRKSSGLQVVKNLMHFVQMDDRGKRRSTDPIKETAASRGGVAGEFAALKKRRDHLVRRTRNCVMRMTG